jgi:glycosyltransferase involved in cell wall biosynthesis
MTKLVILDPSLKTFNGHFLTYDNAVADGALKCGLQTIIFAAQGVDAKLPVHGELIPAFRDPLEHSFIPSPFNRIQASTHVNKWLLHKRFLEDLNRTLTADRIGQNPIIYLHTTTQNQIAPLVDWTASNKNLSPTVVIMLRYTPSPNPYYPRSQAAEAYQQALAYIIEKGVGQYIRLVTDSEILAEEYGLITSLPVHVLPIPHTSHDWGGVLQKGVPTLTYLGNARSTKGFQYLPHIVDSIADDLDKGVWRAEFQSNVMFGRDTEVVFAVQMLRQRNVIMHEGELSVDQYNDLLCRSSLVVVPYQLLYYYAQTSGVMCEALAAGKPVVVPRGTWMSKQVAGMGVGETFLPGDRISLSQAVRKAMKNIDELREKAQLFRAEWVRRHNPDNFASALLRVVGS